MKRTVSAKGSSRLSATWIRPALKRRRRRDTQFAPSITGAKPDLQPRKVYEVLPDRAAARSNYLRVIDEFGEDHLYPEGYFGVVKLPRKAEDGLSAPI